MKKTKLKQIIKEELIKILVEAKIFDSPSELLSGVDKFLNDLYVNKTTNWQSTLNGIIEQETGYLNTANQIFNLTNQVEKELNILNNFDQDIRLHMQKYDEIYQKSGDLSSQDNKMYDQLEELDSRIYNTINQLEEYIDNLKELSKHYEDLDNLIRYLSKYKFKI